MVKSSKMEEIERSRIDFSSLLIFLYYSTTLWAVLLVIWYVVFFRVRSVYPKLCKEGTGRNALFER